jgi:hypothetical protein
MIIKMLKEIWQLKNRDYIPPLPRGALSSDYQSLDEDSRRVMARMGIRSPAGLTKALRRAGVASVDELIAQLNHFKPRRRVAQRLNRALDAIFGGLKRPAHEQDIKRLMKRTPDDLDLLRRHDRARAAFRKGGQE